MTEPRHDVPPLRGWDAIAQYLGKSRRTVQRWEDRHGLPVFREGDTVLATAVELDRWVRSWARYGSLPEDAPEHGDSADRAEAPQPEAPGPIESLPPPDDAMAPVEALSVAAAPRRRWSRRQLAAAVALLVTALCGAIAWSRLAPRIGPPARWSVANRTLTVVDAKGGPVLVHDLGYAPHRVALDPSYPADQQTVHLADVDGDGRVEVLVMAADGGRHEGRLLCFEADGRLRFSIQPSGSRRFGTVEYAGPWMPNSAHLAVREDGTRALWVTWNHMPWFPSRLQRISPRGEVLAEYWSDGHLWGSREARLAGRSVVLAFGTNNELHGGSLAIFDSDRVGGRAPALKAEYHCSDCSGGDPLEFFVFPPSCIWRRDGAHATVREVSVDAGGRLRVTVEGGWAAAGGWAGPTLTYELGPTLVPERLRLSSEFVAMHAALEKRRLVDHPLGSVDEAALQPVLRWDGSRFVELARVPVER
jgi:hypothetical protein